MSYGGYGKTINGNRLRISGSGHVITGNFNSISGSGHVINGNGNKISGGGHIVNGSDNKLSGSGHIVNGKSVSSGPSSITSFTTARSNGKIVKTQVNVGNVVSNVFGSLGGLFGINVSNVNGVRNSFNFMGNNIGTIVSGNGSVTTMITGGGGGGGGTTNVVFSNDEDDVEIFVNGDRSESTVKTVEEGKGTGLYDANDKCKIPSEDALTLDEEIRSDEDNDKDVCKVCFERKKRCLVRPCNHYILCITCSRIVGLKENPKCPECMGFADSFEIVYT